MRSLDRPSPTKGAIPLWRLLFAHPEILASISGAVESLSTSTDTIIVAAADADGIQIEGVDQAVQIDEQGAIVFRRYVSEGPDGELSEHEEPQEIFRPWDSNAGPIVAMAWRAGLIAFQHLLQRGEIVLEGQHPSVLSPWRNVPLDALRAAGSDEIAWEWWPKCQPDYAAGSLRLLSGDRVWGVHIVVPSKSPQRQKSAGERDLERELRRQVQSSPGKKLFTRQDVAGLAVERGLPENAGERVFDKLTDELDPKHRAIWRRRARIPGGKTPLKPPA